MNKAKDIALRACYLGFQLLIVIIVTSNKKNNEMQSVNK